MNHASAFYEKLDKESVRCSLCPHGCKIGEGKFGICRVRKNINNRLYSTTYGTLIAENIDPVEKKPLYHFLPGSSTYSIAAPGCNFSCKFCQNWQISQIKNQSSERSGGKTTLIEPSAIVAAAKEAGCKSIAFTYTEPTVFYEFMMDVSEIAQKAGLKTIMVSNGFITVEALKRLCTVIDAFNIDLKSFSNDFYRKMCGGCLEPVLNTIEFIHSANRWLEVTTLLIPGENDSAKEVDAVASFIASIEKEVPWHVSRFFPAYKLSHFTATPIKSFQSAVDAAARQGLKYLYLGNISKNSVTRCPECSAPIIEREGYTTHILQSTPETCPVCATEIKGIWR